MRGCLVMGSVDGSQGLYLVGDVGDGLGVVGGGDQGCWWLVLMQ